MFSGRWLLVSLSSLLYLRTCCTIDRICAELVRGPWDSEDMGSSPGSSLAVDMGQVSPFHSWSFFISKMSYAGGDGLLQQL